MSAMHIERKSVNGAILRGTLCGKIISPFWVHPTDVYKEGDKRNSLFTCKTCARIWKNLND